MTAMSSDGMLSSGAGADEPGLAALVGRLIDDSRSVVSAEVTLYKAKAAERIAAYKSAIVFFAAAAILALAALVALLVGLIGGAGLAIMAMALTLPHGVPEALATLSGVGLLALGHHLNRRAGC